MKRSAALLILWLAGKLYNVFGPRAYRLASWLIHWGFVLGVERH